MRGPRGQHRGGDEFRGGGPPWSTGAWGGGWGGGGRRMRRGDTRQVVLRALLDGPAHGYEIIRRLEERSAGLWRPSAGSVYPTLQLLEEQGLVSSRDDSGKRVYELTDEGRAQCDRQAPGDMPWETPEGLAGRHVLRDTMVQLQLAARQVAMAADEARIERATAILKETRQKLYQLLAED
jgi:DNA-binding PadR family transcriptional regulator